LIAPVATGRGRSGARIFCAPLKTTPGFAEWFEDPRNYQRDPAKPGIARRKIREARFCCLAALNWRQTIQLGSRHRA